MSRTGFLLSVCSASLALVACSKSPAPPPALAPDVAPIPTAAIPTPSPSEPPAESSLALKRGTLSLASQEAIFLPCSGSPQLWVIDQTDGVLRRTFASEATPLELYIEAHGERAELPATPAAARAYTGAFILEEVLHAAPTGESSGCKEAAPTYIVAAKGNEPFWAIEVHEDKMIWRQPEAPKEIVMPAPESQVSEGTVGYKGAADGHTLELLVDEQHCRDSMSGAFYAYSARAVLDGKELKGCARIGD